MVTDTSDKGALWNGIAHPRLREFVVQCGNQPEAEAARDHRQFAARYGHRPYRRVHLHGVLRDDYGYALETLATVLDAEGRKGKIRHIGITEAAIVDHTNEMLKRALSDPVWEVFMVAFHMMHQGARSNVFAQTQAKGVGTLLMFAVRSIFTDPRRIAREVKELAAKGLVDPSLAETDDPLGFLIHDGGAANLVEAAYRFARHEPGVDVVLFGTGNADHLRSNVAS